MRNHLGNHLRKHHLEDPFPIGSSEAVRADALLGGCENLRAPSTLGPGRKNNGLTHYSNNGPPNHYLGGGNRGRAGDDYFSNNGLTHYSNNGTPVIISRCPSSPTQRPWSRGRPNPNQGVAGSDKSLISQCSVRPGLLHHRGRRHAAEALYV